MATRTGGCGCGAIRYSIEGEPVALAVCHCTECQKATGSAFGMSLIVKSETLTVTGDPKVYRRIADSGNPMDCYFCDTCGVRVYHDPQGMPGTFNVKPGTLDDRSWLAPNVQVWTKSKQPWLKIAGEIPEIESQP